MKDGLVVDAYGTKLWYKNGELHREDGPAVEYKDGTLGWHIGGILHRKDGPAVIYDNGDIEWWVDGTQYTEQEFLIYRLSGIK